MSSRYVIGFMAGALVLSGAPTARADVVVEDVDTGATGNTVVSIGGDTLSLQTTQTFGPPTLFIYDSYYGGDYYADSYQGVALGLGGLGGQISFTPGGLLSAGALIQSGTQTVSSEILGGYQDNYGTGTGTHAIPYYYNCGFYECEGYSYYSYSYLVNEGVSDAVSPLGYGSAGYLGLNLTIGGQTHFGWAEVEMGGNPLQPTLDILELAYETNANTAIAAGATADIADVPEPASLAMLALGLSGVAVLRLRRARAAAAPRVSST
jgi:hypothetical protein